jgi:hypothetical protein
LVLYVWALSHISSAHFPSQAMADYDPGNQKLPGGG